MKKRRRVIDRRAGNKQIGSSLNEFLQEEGVLEKTRAVAIKEVVVCQIEQAMLKDNITKMQIARRMRTSRSAPDRLLDPANDAVTLLTLSRAPNPLVESCA
jgi:antitoxin HicB